MEETDEGGVGSEGVMNRSGFTAKHARSIVSWLRLAKTLATRNRAVEPLSAAAAAAAAASPIFCASPVTLIVGRVSAVKKVVWLDFGEKGGVGPLWIIASVAILFDTVTNSKNLSGKSQQNFELETQTVQMGRALTLLPQRLSSAHTSLRKIVGGGRDHSLLFDSNAKVGGGSCNLLLIMTSLTTKTQEMTS